METYIAVIITVLVLVDIVIIMGLSDTIYTAMERSAAAWLIISVAAISFYYGTYYSKINEFEHTYEKVNIEQSKDYQKWLMSR